MAYARVPSRCQIRECIVPVSLAVLLTACLPLLAFVAFALRTVILIAGPILFLVIGLSLVRWKALGEWWGRKVSAQSSYRGLSMARDVAFHRGHSWALVDGEVVVGADDIVQRAIGRIEEVVAPEAGRHVEQGEPLFRLRHGDRMIDLPSPVSGTVVGTNVALDEHPELVNEKPFGSGWVVRMRGEHVVADRGHLLSGHRAWGWFRDEVDLLMRVLPPEDPSGEEAVADEMPRVHRRVDDGAWSVVRDALSGARGVA